MSPKPLSVPHRDPQTGKFVKDSDHDFDEIEEFRVIEHLSIPASTLDGSTGERGGQQVNFEGVLQYDLEEVIDRHQVAVLLWAHHRMNLYFNATATTDGTATASVEWSISPARKAARVVGDATQAVDDTESPSGITTVNRDQQRGLSESQDMIGPVLQASAVNSWFDVAVDTNHGGAGDQGETEWEGGVFADPVLDDRDSFYWNGSIDVWNTADQAVHLDVSSWHVYGVMDD